MQLSGFGVQHIPIVLQVRTHHQGLAVGGDLGTFAAFAVQGRGPDHPVGRQVQGAKPARVTGKIKHVGGGAGGNAGNIFRRHAAGIVPQMNPLDEGIIVVGIQHDNAGAVGKHRPLQASRACHIEQMTAVNGEVAARAAGDGHPAGAAVAASRSGRCPRHWHWREAEWRWIARRAGAGRRSCASAIAQVPTNNAPASFEQFHRHPRQILVSGYAATRKGLR